MGNTRRKKVSVFKGKGYQLAYSEYGLSTGIPIIFHHGLVGSSILPPIYNDLATAANVKLVAIARPGYGLSTPYPMNTIADWGYMVSPLLEELGINTDFGTIGISAGSPYAYALANTFGHRILGVWIASGIPYFRHQEIWDAYPQEKKEEYQRCQQLNDEQLAKLLIEYLKKEESQNSTSAEMQESLDATLSHNGLGIVREIRMQLADWGFSPFTLECGVGMWHSKDDDEIPFAPIKIMKQLMQFTSLHCQEEPTHIPSEATLTAIFESIRYASSSLRN